MDSFFERNEEYDVKGRIELFLSWNAENKNNSKIFYSVTRVIKEKIYRSNQNYIMRKYGNEANLFALSP